MCIQRTEDTPVLFDGFNQPIDNLNKNLCNDHCDYVEPEKITCLNEYNQSCATT